MSGACDPPSWSGFEAVDVVRQPIGPSARAGHQVWHSVSRVSGGCLGRAGWRPQPRSPYRGCVSSRRIAAAAAGALVVCGVLTACAMQPQPVETRLPPGYDASSASPTASVPSPTVVTLSPTPDADATSAPLVTVVPSPSTPGVDPGALSCGDGGSQSVSGAEQSVRVTGTCAELTVSGSAVTVDASGATIGTLRVSGDRARVVAAEIDMLVVQGNDGSVESSGGVGSVDLSGDRTTVQAAGAIAAVTVRGQDNVVRAPGGVGTTTVEGRGNQIG